MVGPGMVDDELQDEIKQECARKYGPVEKCFIYEVILWYYFGFKQKI